MPYTKPTEAEFDVNMAGIATFDIAAGTFSAVGISDIDTDEATDPGEALYQTLAHFHRRTQNLPDASRPTKWGTNLSVTNLANGNINHAFVFSFERKPVSGGKTNPA